MPVDRFLHPCCGHSDKVRQLTDLEFRVWTQYILSADDFGVMRLAAVAVQAGNDALQERSKGSIQRCLERLVSLGLVLTFEHQGRTYCCQGDWQKYQKIRYPRSTIEPTPPTDVLTKCDENTRALFQIKIRSISEKPPDDSGEVSEKLPEDFSRARAREEANGLRLTANGNGSRQTAARGTVGMGGGSGVMGGALPREHLRHVWCGRVCVPDFLHGQFVKATGADDEALRAFYRETFEAIPEGEAVESDALKFWRPRVTARWAPPAPPAPPGQSMFAPGTSTEEIVERLTKKPSGASR